MKCLLRCTLTLFAVAVAGLLTLACIVRFAGGWLNNSETPRKADLILVLAGEPARFPYAADLFLEKRAKQVLVTKPVRLRPYRILDDLGIAFPRLEDVYREILQKKGVPDDRILYIGDELLSTLDEARAFRTYAAANGIHSVLVVTSPYHVRRVRMIFHDEVPGIATTVIATPYEPYPERWWADQDTARSILLELAKILFYIAGGSFTSTAPQNG